MQLNSNTEKQIIEWLDNVIGVPTKELGLLAGDGIRRWRISNQLKTLSKAIEKSKKLNLPLKVISPKLICPLLENCSLEDDDFMQDKWANLLTNMLDSEQNIQNNIFPYILSQISKNEYIEISEHYLIDTLKAKKDAKLELAEFEEQYISEKDIARNRYRKMLDLDKSNRKEIYDLCYGKETLIHQLEKRKRNLEFIIRRKIDIRDRKKLKPFEMDNLIRLGLFEAIPISLATSMKNDYNEESPVDILIETAGFRHKITQLGIFFVLACTESLKEDVSNR
jgi:hypothetical protein